MSSHAGDHPPASNVPPPGAASVSAAAAAGDDAGPAKKSEVKLVSQSNLFYWWPVWACAFFMAAWTYFENNRLAVVPAGTLVSQRVEGGTEYELKVPAVRKDGDAGVVTEPLRGAVTRSKNSEQDRAAYGMDAFETRVSEHPWLGSVFLFVLILVIIVTNVPMRGLWSFIAIMLVVLVAVLITLFNGWEAIFQAVGRHLLIYINLAGYLFIGTVVFVLWALSTFIFDRRTYVIFTPGQIKVCEHIGAGVQAYDVRGVSLEKQRDDVFRHWVLGFGSGDLIIHLPGGGEKKDVRMPNVLGINWQLKTVEDIMRSTPVT